MSVWPVTNVACGCSLAGLGMGIKRVLKHPRPAATCEALGICHKHGMPSSHMQVQAPASWVKSASCAVPTLLEIASELAAHPTQQLLLQVMAFAVTTCLLLYWQRRQGHFGTSAAQHSQRSAGCLISRLIQQLEIFLLGWLAAAVGYARVRLGYHTPGQVVAGAVVGCAFALGCTGLAAGLDGCRTASLSADSEALCSCGTVVPGHTVCAGYAPVGV
jgi:hypothetical protein